MAGKWAVRQCRDVTCGCGFWRIFNPDGRGVAATAYWEDAQRIATGRARAGIEYRPPTSNPFLINGGLR